MEVRVVRFYLVFHDESQLLEQTRLFTGLSVNIEIDGLLQFLGQLEVCNGVVAFEGLL